jgi:hypothetical protein
MPHKVAVTKRTKANPPTSLESRKAVYFGDNVILHWLFKQTMNHLELLTRAVHEGRAVDEASNFARWLSFSGLIKIFEAYPQPVPLLVDGPAMRLVTDKLVSACGVIYKGGRMPENPSQSVIDEMNAKMDFIISQMAKTASPSFVDTAVTGRPGLLVIQGGASCAAV